MQLLNNILSVFLISLVFLVSAQRPSNNNHRDLGPRELARQNQITQQILEAYIQKKLGLARNPNPLLRPPSILDILPANKQNEERLTRQLIHKKKETEALPEVEEEDPPEVEVEGDTELAQNEDERLQSVESEQIDSIYSEGT